MINNKIIKNISERNIYLIDNNFFIDVYFNARSSNFSKAKFIKTCFLPFDLDTLKPIHLKSDESQNRKSYDNGFFFTNRKNKVQSNFYSKNIITANLQVGFQDSVIEKSNPELSSVIKNTIKIKKSLIENKIQSNSNGFKLYVYVLDRHKKILETFSLDVLGGNIFSDYRADEDIINDVIFSYATGVDISFEEFTINDNRVLYSASGPTLFIPGYSNEAYNRQNTLQQNNLNIKLSKDSASISMTTSELFEQSLITGRVVQDNNILLRRKILSNYDNNIIKNLRNTIKNENLEKSSLDLKIQTSAGCYTKSIGVSKNKAYSLYNTFLIRHKDRYTFENFKEKYLEEYVDADDNDPASDGIRSRVVRHNFISLDTEFLKSIVMNQTKFITIEFFRTDLNQSFCFYLDDTLNPQNKITPYLVKNSNKAVYLIETLYNNNIYYTPNVIKSIICNNVQVYPENSVQNFDDETFLVIDNDFLNASREITDSIISNEASENSEVFLDRNLIEKSTELFARLKYETDDSGILMSDLLNNTLIKTTSTFISGGELVEKVSYDKLSNNISNINNNLYGIKVASTASSTMSISMSFIVFEKDTLSSLYNDNLSDDIKESYCKTLNNISPKKFSKIDASINNLSIRNNKNNQLEFEKIFNAIDSGKSLKKKKITKENAENNLQINFNQDDTIEDKVRFKKENLNKTSKEALIKNYGKYTIDKKFYKSNALLEYKNKAFYITRKSKSKSNILSIDLLSIKKELGFNINKKDLQIYYHTNLGFDKNNKLTEDMDVKLNSYLVDNEYTNFIQLFKFDIKEEKLLINIEETIFNFNKSFYEKSNKLFVNDKKLVLKNILQRFLLVFENYSKEEYFVIEDNVTPSIVLKDKFKSQNKDKLNIDLNQKHIKHPNIIVKMV